MPTNKETFTAAMNNEVDTLNSKTGGSTKLQVIQLATETATITPLNADTLTVTPTNTDQTITPTSPKNGFSEVDVEAVICDNLLASVIKQGEIIKIGTVTDDDSVAYVTGEYAGVTPTGNQDITTLNEYDVSTKATARVSAAERAKIIAENIRSGVEILGVTGEYAGSGFDVASFMAGTMTNVEFTGSTLRDFACYEYTGMTSFTDTALNTMGQFAFSNCTNLTSFTASSDLTSLPASAFNGCINLRTIDLSHITSIGVNALYNCKNVTNIGTLSATNINSYGAYYLGNTSRSPFIYSPSSLATISNYGLFYANVSELRGTIGNVSSYGLSNFRDGSYTSLTTISCSFTGSLGQYALSQNTNVSSIDISTSTITSLGGYVFYELGQNRSNASSNILSLDLRNSTFKTVNGYDFGHLKYIDVRLPSTVETIANSAFNSGNNLRVFLPDVAPITLSSTGAFSGTYSIFIPYNRIMAYRSATNWSASAILNNVKGYAPANTFTAGDTLPTHTAEGYAITWYSDIAMTTTITTCPVGSPEIYCTVASVQSKYVVSFDIKGEGTLSVVDGSSNPVDISAGYVLADTGDVFVITAGTAVAGYTVDFKINGVAETSPYTLTVGTANVTVAVNAYSGSFNPDFDAATWAELKAAVLAGQASVYAPYIGHTKQVTLSTNEVVEFMLVDTTGQIYDYADNSGKAGLILQQVNCLATSAVMNSSGSNSGGYNQSDMATTTIPAFVNTLPSEVRDVISEVKIVRDSGGSSSTLTTGTGYAFLAAEKEVSTTRTNSVQVEFNALSTFEYWQSHTQATDRIKNQNGSAKAWWLSSSRSGYGTSFCLVFTSGNLSFNDANNSYGVVPCLAI